ncbi:MAG: N-acetylglucosamine-6-phosphate deacetylase [Clostridia bacterium]|nr:N-acetylglucosamine-6-phosphate deacetylase [Clostridia bacterium]
MIIYARKLLTPAGWRENQLVAVRNGLIESIEPGAEGDLSADILAPGFFDIHCHGGEGFYTLRPEWPSFEKYLMRLAERGVTDLLLGLSTYSGADGYRAALDFAREAMNRQARGELPGAYIQGVHLEGPFLNPRRCGAMNPEAMLTPSPEAYDALFGACDDIVRLVTIAPERDGARELTAHLLKKGICVQAGHTDATCEQAEAAFGWGVNSLCHTFNAARPIHHRDPGVVNAALINDGVYCEVICDFKHLHPNTVKMIYRLKGPGRMAMISDSVAVTGLPDGEHTFGGHTYLVVNGTHRVNGGETLSGGACYLDGGVKNLFSIGIPAGDALRMASRTPAERLRRGDIGVMRPGARAHFAALDEALNPVFSVIDETVYMRK